MKCYDIVYILRNDIKPDELRYSLRSLKNFPHGKVIFAGGVPEGLKPDLQIEFKQTGTTKYTRARSTYDTICTDDRISDNFWLFNDDFYVLKPVENMPAYYEGSLFERILRIEDKYGHRTPYTRRLRGCAKWLEENGYTTDSYELHLPMLLNRKKLRSIIANEGLPVRSTYGNIYGVGEEMRRDVKIMDISKDPNPDMDFLSTSDASYRAGKAGKFIRSKFDEKCEYEV